MPTSYSTTTAAIVAIAERTRPVGPRCSIAVHQKAQLAWAFPRRRLWRPALVWLPVPLLSLWVPDRRNGGFAGTLHDDDGSADRSEPAQDADAVHRQQCLIVVPVRLMLGSESCRASMKWI
jgi:hypothetical protein